MRKLLLKLFFILPILFWAASAHATCTTPCVQVPSVTSNTGTATQPISTAGNVTSTNTLYVWSCWVDTGSNTFTSFSKTSGSSSVGTFVTVGSNGSGATEATGNNKCNQGYAPVTGTGSITVTCTLSGIPSGILTCGLIEFSGIVVSSPVDTQGMNAQTNPGLGSNAVTSCGSTCNSSQNGDVLAGFNLDFNGNVTTVAAGTGFTANFAGTSGLQSEYQSQATSGSAAATFTWQTTGGGDTGISGVIAFKTTAPVASPGGAIGGSAGIGGKAGIGL